MKQKVTYISIINAIAIIAVVIGHLDVAGDKSTGTPVVNVIERFGAFQMPLFMCVSGFLFAMTSGYRKKYSDLVKNKVRRLLIPFVFLSLFTFVFKLCLPSSMLEHEVGFNAGYIFKIFFVPFRGPVPHLWFVISLFTIFLLTPILKRTVGKTVFIVMTFLLLLMLTFIPSYLKTLNIEIFAIDKTLSMTVWFYLGMVMYLKSIPNTLAYWRITIVTGLLYIYLVYFVEQSLVNNLVCMLVGIVFIFSLSNRLAEALPNLFGSWRNYTYQIYLLHMYPIMACKFIYRKHIIGCDDLWFWLIWTISLLSSIALPAIIAKTGEKMPQCLKQLIGL